MLKRTINRLLAAIITFMLVVTLTFFLMQTVPGNPFLGEEQPRPEVAAIMMERYGLDQPVHVQFGKYVERMLHGDFGISIKMKWGEEISSIIFSRFPISASLGIIAFLLSVSIGIPLGVFSALKGGSRSDRAIISTCAITVSIPGFVTSTVLMFILGVQLKWVPFVGLTEFKSYLIPVFCLMLGPTSFITRLMRSNMMDVLSQDYVKTARAKGLSERVVLFKHALRNAIIPVVTYLGPQLVGIVTGSFVIEKIFTIPGLSRYFVEAIPSRDYPVIMGTTIFFALFLITANFVVDLLYGAIDPRIRHAE